MTFVVDGSQWSFDGYPVAMISKKIEVFLGFIETSRERGEKVWIGDDFQTRPMLGGADLWSMGLQPEIYQEIAAWLGRASLYLDEEAWPVGMEDTFVSIGDKAREENADVAWAHHSVRARSPVGCLSILNSGYYETESSAGTARIAWIRKETERIAFWRDAIVLTGDSERSLQRMASHAYPDIFFHENALAGLSNLAGGYFALRELIRSTLASLNDFGSWVFTCPPPALRPSEFAGTDPSVRPSNQIIERRLRGFGIEGAPENPNVYKNFVCRKAREVLIGSEILYCEWHVKLEPHRNRIHFHPPASCAGNKVVVGIIDEHLPLP